MVTQDLDHKVRKVQLMENCANSGSDDRIADSRSLFILEQNNEKLVESNLGLETENAELVSRIYFLER